MLYDVAFFLRTLPANLADGAAHATRVDILAWLDSYGRTVAQATVVRRFASLRAYYDWLLAEGERDPILGDPTAGIHLRHPPHVPKQPFSADELRRILAACSPRRPQDRAMMLLAIDTGLRRSELTGLRARDLDLGGGVVRVRGKGGKERLVALGERSLSALGGCLDGRPYPWYSQRTHGPMTADGFYRLCRRLSERTGLRVFPHRFRTTWACMFLEATGGDVGSAQVLMGHAKVETTLRYAAWTRQRRALDQGRRVAPADRL